MNARAARTAARTLAGIGVACAIGAVVVWLVTGAGDLIAFDGVPFVAAFVAIPLVGGIIASRQPWNRTGWILLGVGLAGAVGLLGDAWAAGADGSDRGWASLVSQLGLGGLLGLPLVLLLFPDGALPSRRWRPALWLSIAAGVTLLVGTGLSPELVDYPGVGNPIGVEALRGTPIEGGGIGWLLLIAAIVTSAASVVVRFRGARGEARLQLKWLAASAVAILVGWLLLVAGFDADPDDLGSTLLRVPFALGLLSFPVAIAVSILRYRLYDIDVVISKSVVVGTLAVFIGGVYVVAVVGIGALLDDTSDPVLSIAATVLVALLFEPVRERARRAANRLVYGERATPYEVMADFAGRVATTPSLDRVLPEMAEAAGIGVGASQVVVSVRLSEGREHVERWGPDSDEDPHAVTHPPTPFTIAVRHHGEPVGEIGVRKPPDEPLTRQDETLLGDLAAQAGLALHNVRLNDELSIRLAQLDRQAAAIAASRERLLTARDAQRRGLERDINDGPERQLLEIRHRLDVLDRTAEPATVDSELARLVDAANATLEALRDLARGIFPPLLAERGIVPALAAHVRKVGARAEIEAEPSVADGRFDADVEACVYFCCLQAIQNVKRHAGNAPCVVRLSHDGGTLAFSIEDEGEGFDASATARGMGLRIVQDRVDALEGDLEVTSARGRGTRITVRIPALALEGAPA